ncbi:substrate-binding domain-containing protein [Nonomuraea sp. NPDC046802]|uniref:sugar ABC transporter substrate-binding protein n=1 Tax=Nonomuraea sp. NPDC046802 TaxID=3154919 RepID=UPI0033D335B3
MPSIDPPRRSLALLFALVVALAGCSTGQEDDAGAGAKAQKGEIRIGAVMFARDLEFWQLVEAGMRDAARSAGVKINVEVSNRQLATEAQLVDTLHARGDNVLVIAPLDNSASAATLRKADQYGMTVVQYNSKASDQTFTHFVGVDNAELGRSVGKLAKEYVDAELGGQAKMALLTGDTEPNGTVRKNAFLKEVPGGKVVTTAEAVGSPDAGAKAFETVLQSNPDIDVVWAWNGAAMQGAAVAAQRHKSKVKIFGIDMSKQVAQIMRAPGSPVQAVADQHAYDVGKESVTLAIKAAKGAGAAATSVPPATYSAGDAKGIDAFLAELGKAGAE